MGDVSNEKIFDRAVDLIVHGDRMLQGWTGRYIVIQGGLAFAAATLIKWRAESPELLKTNYIALYVVAQIAIVALGISSAWLITKLIRNELDWQKNYVTATRRAEGDSPLLYQFEVQKGKSRTANYFHWASIIMTGIWTISLVFIVLSQSQATP